MSKVQKARGVGSSAFTHVDDQLANVHPSDPTHQDALFYGGNVAPHHELQEIVLGPPAYGSPDPRTLGFTMTPVVDSPSAPGISNDYAGGKPVGSENEAGGVSDESDDSEKTWHKSDKKDDLLKEAQSRGLDVTDKNSKDEIVEALEADDAEAEEDGNDEDETGEDEGDEDES